MKMTFFQFYTCAIVVVFIAMLVFVTVVAYSRDGSTPELSRKRVQQVRFEGIADL